MTKKFLLTIEATQVSMEVIERSKDFHCRLVDSAKFTANPISGKHTTFHIMKNGVPVVLVQAIYNGSWRVAVSHQTPFGRETMLDKVFQNGQKLEMAIPEECYVL